eukprot:TRINITY_DN15290_c0_g1_i1.p1 TRINITY_DN15290_c0_g1~~TRINITY_DN15290_c0_g1_i1.p1  ORF type:complete len:711 (-),score=120.15 TRINITY_DN15290_c0_g1_i1:60-2123(-)
MDASQDTAASSDRLRAGLLLKVVQQHQRELHQAVDVQGQHLAQLIRTSFEVCGAECIDANSDKAQLASGSLQAAMPEGCSTDVRSYAEMSASLLMPETGGGGRDTASNAKLKRTQSHKSGHESLLSPDEREEIVKMRHSALSTIRNATTHVREPETPLRKVADVLRKIFGCSDCKLRSCGPVGIMNHVIFEYVSTSMILLSAILMGSEVEISTRQFEQNTEVEAMMQVCSFYFIVELAIRFLALKQNFFRDESCYWNALDTFFVIVSISELILGSITLEAPSSAGNVGPLKTSVKMVKMVRLIRIFRIFRFWRGLWDFTLMIIHSMKSLFMAIILLSLIAYVFAVCLTMNSADWLKSSAHVKGESDWGQVYSSSTEPKVQEIYIMFGSLAKSAYTLIQCVLGGVSWGVVTDSIMYVDNVSTVLLFAFIFFVMLAVLNIITGVFVEEAMKTHQSQKDVLVQKELQARQEYALQLLTFFKAVDVDNSGVVTRDEVCAILEEKEMAAYMRVLGFQVEDADRLFRLLDRDGSGELAVDEFVDGCVKLKGAAQSIDVFEITMECRKLERQLQELAESQSDLTDVVSRMPPPQDLSSTLLKFVIEMANGHKEPRETTPDSQSTRISDGPDVMLGSSASPGTKDATQLEGKTDGTRIISCEVDPSASPGPEDASQLEGKTNGTRRISCEVDQEI